MYISDIYAVQNRLMPVCELLPETVIHWRNLITNAIKFENKVNVESELITPSLTKLVKLLIKYDAYWASIMSIQNPSNKEKKHQMDYIMLSLILYD